MNQRSKNSDFLTAVKMSILVFRLVTPYDFVGRYQRLEETRLANHVIGE
jgi:hypothetical protein